MTPRRRRWLALALTPFAAAAIVLAPAASPSWAAPNDPAATPDEGGENDILRDVLDSTGSKYVAAKDAYDKSKKRQDDLQKDVAVEESKRDALLPQVAKIANASYRTGRLSTLGLMLNASTPDVFFDRAGWLNEVNDLNNDKLDQLNDAIESVSKSKAVLDQEVQSAQKQVDAMEGLKKEAEKALSLVGGETLTGGLVTFKSADATPAPRAADGTWPKESCKVDDPTTSGCITPRTRHMYDEIRKAGFDRFVGCHRNGGPFEHPKGRACDWALQNVGFAKWHNEDTRTYGNNLMAFAVRNADRLGILYVIWNRQIWFPATGWKRYSGPSTHEDHVHISML